MIGDEDEEAEEYAGGRKRYKSSQEIDIFSSDVSGIKKNSDMSKFISNNMLSFNKVNTNAGNKLRFQEMKDGKQIVKAEEIKQRQHRLFIERQDRVRKETLSTIRKYKIGELPDIVIQYKVSQPLWQSSALWRFLQLGHNRPTDGVKFRWRESRRWDVLAARPSDVQARRIWWSIETIEGHSIKLTPSIEHLRL